MKTRHNRGFTLWELLVGLLVVGIVLGIGVPNLLEFRRNNVMAATANDLISALMLARNEAVKRQAPVTLCASPDPQAANPTCSQDGSGTNGGYIVWVDENANGILTDATDGNAAVDAAEVILQRRDDPDPTLTIYASGGIAPAPILASGHITYGANGFPRNAIGVGIPPLSSVLYCDARGNVIVSGTLSAARAVRIDVTGRGQVLREVVQITPIITAMGVTCP